MGKVGDATVHPARQFSALAEMRDGRVNSFPYLAGRYVQTVHPSLSIIYLVYMHNKARTESGDKINAEILIQRS